MSGETIRVYGTPKTLEAAGGAIANNAIVQADDASYSTAADGANYPDAEFTLTFTYGSAPSENTVLALYARPLNVDGTLDTEEPEAARSTRLIGTFVVNNVTTSQTAHLVAYDVPREADYYVHNVGTGQSVSAGWVLKATPRTYTAAA